ncbi:UNVERIFIED_CONTAM: hypothetical protein RMT77_011806 [Armadillidium vulgare]
MNYVNHLVMLIIVPVLVTGLQVRVDVPIYKERGSNAELKCLYSLEGSSLYSVKWYKGDKQFYQYIPAKRQPKSEFPVPTINVDLGFSKEGMVFLRNLSMSSSGSYRCEVITEAPHFHTKFGSGNMTVIDLPESAPVFTGLQPSYQLGEEVYVNCSSFSSKPAASLEWQINDVIVNNSHWLIPYPITVDENGLETSVLGLQFIATRNHFRGGNLRLKCKAQIGNLYYQSQESVVLSTSFMQRKQEDAGRYIPLFYYNASPSTTHSLLVWGFIFHILLRNL